MLKLKNISIVDIRVIAQPGTRIGNCLQEAIKLAVTEWRNVRLEHNAKQYNVNVSKLLEICINPEK